MNPEDANDAAPASDAPEPNSKKRVFLAAESLLAEHGFEAVSTRDIVARAGVNIAAVNYHYGSKSNLLLDIFRTRAKELNRERSRLLTHALETRPGDARAILRALVDPSILWVSEERRIALKFLNRARSEGPQEMREIIRTDVRHLRRFVEALADALPQLSHEALLWQFHFALGVLHHNQQADYDRLALLSDGACSPADREKLRDRLLEFISGGFGI